MNYNYDNGLLLLDVPNRNRLIVSKSEIISIKEENRNSEMKYCIITLKNGTEYRYTCSMDEILANLKPITAF